MKATRKLTPWILSALCLGLSGWATAQDMPKDSKGDGYGEKSTAGTPAKVNKASGIIGMEVRNQDGEHLGHIKDVVFDLKSERVSYAVLTTTPKVAMGIDEKLLAVPVNALTVSPDEKHLILNADKSKVEAAAGFDKNNWPNVSNPSWGAEPFWQGGTNQDQNVTPRTPGK